MGVQFYDSADDFRRVAVDIYRRDPIEATVELTVLRDISTDGNEPPLLLTVSDDSGRLVGAALRTPPFPLACNGLRDAPLDEVVDALVSEVGHLNGVRGRSDIASRFAAAWSDATGAHGTVTMRERLYRLDALRPPVGVSGEPRPAQDADIGLVAKWISDFRREAFGVSPDLATVAESVVAAQALGDVYLLWIVNDEPVSLAGARAPVAGVCRVGPVYTPPARRGHGYGSAVTAAVATWCHRNGGSDVVLFTDLANEVSNAIYQRIGFRPVSDSARIDFAMPAG